MTFCLHRLYGLQALSLYCTRRVTWEIACVDAYVHESYFLGATLPCACLLSLSSWDSVISLRITWIVGTFLKRVQGGSGRTPVLQSTHSGQHIQDGAGSI